VPDPSWFDTREESRLRTRAGLGLPDLPLIAFVGRLVPEKGVGWLLQSVSRMTSAAALVVVGDGPQRRELEQVAGALGLRAWFLGARREAEAHQVLAAADVAVIPSLSTSSWVEQFGRVAVEAMAAGVPVVASRSGALPEVLDDAADLVPEGDRQALAAALDRLCHEPSRRLHLSQAGRRRAAHYHPDVLAAQLLDVWTAVAAGTGR
jgi:glycosyltransferase involved in cell wall biosynthesis